MMVLPKLSDPSEARVPLAQSLHVGRPQSNRMHVAQLFLLEASCIAGRMAKTAEEDPQLLTVPFRFPASLVADRMAGKHKI